jgi:uncharacterized repeat protein (TIGR01451 family)
MHRVTLKPGQQATNKQYQCVTFVAAVAPYRDEMSRPSKRHVPIGTTHKNRGIQATRIIDHGSVEGSAPVLSGLAESSQPLPNSDDASVSSRRSSFPAVPQGERTMSQSTSSRWRRWRAASLPVTTAVLAVATFATPRASHAAQGDFSLNFTAAAPRTYNHATGGGAFDDGTKGVDKDVVESLEGGDFACGDTITYLLAIDVSSAPATANQTIELTASFLADTTGQSGAAHTEITYVGVNYGQVAGGEGPGGTDSGIVDDGGSTATLVSQSITPAGAALYTSGATIQGIIRIDDLEASERVIVRVDTRIGCKVYSDPTGNLQADITNGHVVAAGNPAINVGQQTINFKHVGDLFGAGVPNLAMSKTVTTVDGTCPGTENLSAREGDLVKYCYVVTNTGLNAGYNASLTDDNGTPADLTDDFVVPLSGLIAVESDGIANDLGYMGTATGSAVVAAHLRGGTSLTNKALFRSNVKGKIYSVSDTATVFVTPRPQVHPSLAISTTVSTNGLCPGSELVYTLAGSPVTFCYTVTNTGDVAANGIQVTGATGVVNAPLFNLSVGESFTVSSAASPADDVTEIASAAGVDAAYGSPVATETDAAAVDVIHPSLAISTTVSLSGTCPGDELVHVLTDTPVTFCYTVSNTGDVAVGGIQVTGALGSAVNALPFSLGAGESTTVSFSTTAPDDLLETAIAAGTDAIIASPVVTTEDSAAVDVVHPSVRIDTTVSLDGSCPGVDPAAVVANNKVWYCYAVTNTGDDELGALSIGDSNIGSVSTLAGLGVGETQFVTSSPVVITVDTTNTGTSTGADIYGFPVASSDSAFVHAMYADLQLVKTAPAKVKTAFTNKVTYTLAVTNLGDTAAVNSTISDALPNGLTFVSATATAGTCTASGSSVSCAIGNVDPAANVTVTIECTVTGSYFTVTNTAYASTETPDSNYSNNWSQAATHFAPGATRTIGFYSNHPAWVQKCLDYNNGQLNIGWLTLRNETYDNEIDSVAAGNGPDKDTRVETALALTEGILNANVAKWKNGTSRTALEKARMQAGRQLVAAICNATYLGADVPFDLDAAVRTVAGTNANAINAVGSQLDAFNNSGDSISLGVDPGSASTPAWDDPTDPND